MNKVLCLAIFLVAYASFSVFAGTEVQEFSWVVKDRNYTELGSKSQYSGIPAVWTSGNLIYVSFTVSTNDDPAAVNATITSYLSPSIPTAQSSYTYSNGTFTLTYVGDYNPNLLPPPNALCALARILNKFNTTSLDNRTCTQKCFESRSGFAYVGVKLPLKGDDYEYACDRVSNYLENQLGFSADIAKKRYSSFTEDNVDYGLLELYSVD